MLTSRNDAPYRFERIAFPQHVGSKTALIMRNYDHEPVRMTRSPELCRDHGHALIRRQDHHAWALSNGLVILLRRQPAHKRVARTCPLFGVSSNDLLACTQPLTTQSSSAPDQAQDSLEHS